jgi:hypothetical protein
MRADGGFEPDPNPYRPVPVDFSGPICAECNHSRSRSPDTSPNDYICDGFEPKVIRPAQRCSITGKVHEAMLRYARCNEQNDNGQCDRFTPRPSRATIVRIRRTRVSWPRRLAGRFGSWLVSWAGKTKS